MPLKLLTSSDEVKQLKELKRSNAIVFSALWRNKKVAVKKIPKNNFRIEEIKHLLMLTEKDSEKCDSCKLESCEHIIECYGCYEEHKYYCIIYEKAEMNLREYIGSCQKDLNLTKKILKLFHDASKGLSCLHSKGISHLDIKSENILIVNRDGVLTGCIADFGESIKKSKGTLENIQFAGSEV